MTFANNLDPDEAPQNVGLHLRSKLFDIQIIYRHKKIGWKQRIIANFEENNNNFFLPSMQRVKLTTNSLCWYLVCTTVCSSLYHDASCVIVYCKGRVAPGHTQEAGVVKEILRSLLQHIDGHHSFSDTFCH